MTTLSHQRTTRVDPDPALTYGRLVTILASGVIVSFRKHPAYNELLMLVSFAGQHKQFTGSLASVLEQAEQWLWGGNRC